MATYHDLLEYVGGMSLAYFGFRAVTGIGHFVTRTFYAVEWRVAYEEGLSLEQRWDAPNAFSGADWNKALRISDGDNVRAYNAGTTTAFNRTVHVFDDLAPASRLFEDWRGQISLEDPYGSLSTVYLWYCNETTLNAARRAILGCTPIAKILVRKDGYRDTPRNRRLKEAQAS